MIPGGGVQRGWSVRHSCGEEGWVVDLAEWGCWALVEWGDRTRTWERSGDLTPLA